MARVHNHNKNCETCKKMYRPSCSIKNHPWEYVEPTELHQCPHCPYKSSKGQLISKGLFGVVVSLRISALTSKKSSNQKKIIYNNYVK